MPHARLLAIAGICGALAGAPLVAGLAQAGPARAATAPGFTSPPGLASLFGAGTGGTGLGGGGSGSGSGSVTDVNTTVSASGAGIRFSTTKGATTGRKLTFTGTAPRRYDGRLIALQTAAKGRSGWTDAAQVKITPKGTFSGSWKPAASGRFALRAELLPGAAAAALATASTPHTGKVTVEVFKTATATLYGPGLYGNKTACGETLKKTTIGVANRTLKCGTKVAVDYRGHVLVVPVIDRGPYGTGASWDLTMATGAKLGMTATATVATLTPAP